MSETEKPKVIVTNDDGVDSPFLKVLADALKLTFDVKVVAPLSEQSWIGKAISRRGRVNVHRRDVDGIETWAVEGTPADCVNIALGNLYAGEDVVAVISGINIGYNAALSTVLSSGTVGAALESALMGKPAVALSKALPQEVFEQLQMDRTTLPASLQSSLEADAARVVDYVQKAISEHPKFNERIVVHNVNFPADSSPRTETQETSLANSFGSSIFQMCQGEGNSFEFKYQTGQNIDTRTKTDLNCLRDGHISYSLIDFSRLTSLKC